MAVDGYAEFELSLQRARAWLNRQKTDADRLADYVRQLEERHLPSASRPTHLKVLEGGKQADDEYPDLTEAYERFLSSGPRPTPHPGVRGEGSAARGPEA